MSGGKVLVIGSGGREHALCWKLADSPFVQQVYCAPGSVGIATTNKVECVELDIKDYPAIAQWCKEHEIDIVVVGPEDPLANGIVDNLTPLGIKCFGPTKAGARIEADKDWSKSFMNKYQIPTARHKSFTDAAAAKEFINTAPFPALVVKASGLAAGKGVVVAANKEEACQAVDEILTDAKYGAAGQVVVIEELLEGDEVSILAFTDGETVSMMPPAQDHKRVGDGDTGPNTGGMGAYCPCPLITPDQLLDVKEQVLQRAVDGLKAEGIKYVGVLYAGMMVTKSGPMTLEFNCRFGDPETQVLMTLLETDLYKIFKACVEGTLRQIQVTWNTKLSAVGVVIASKGYPETSTKGCVISGLTQVQCTPGLVVFHSGVARGANGSLVTWGGRVLLVCARAGSLRAAAAAATAAAGQVDFPGAHYRKDIAHRAFSKINGLSYLQSGVDIDAAATLVRQIEPIATATHRRGVLGRLGCYSGLFQLSAMDPSLKDPVLVQGTDGVGTKLKIAEMMQKYDTLGQDLVAMCVNDILCAGAEPFAFLDYMACGRLQVDVATTIVKGIADACTLSGCALLGGETAEMPSMYEIGKYDLAGFAVGVVDNLKQLPRTKEIRPGDVVLALPSTGVHSNGYSLVQKIMMETGHRYNEPAAFSTTNKSYGEEFLVPTGIYVKALLPAIKKQLIKGLAHITGGGLLENIPRILPPGIKVKLDATKFNIKPVFGWLQAKGVVSDFEMLRTFNCGVGMVVIVDPVCVKELLDSVDEEIAVVGVVEAMGKEGHQVVVENFKEAMHPLTSPYVAGDRASPQKSLSYKDSGVDIEAGDSLVSLIKPLARSTSRSGVLGGLGGFGGCFQLKAVEEEYKDPVLVLAADGVGTKLKIAQKINQHSTIGIDLVAMCVNDILCNGAAPLTFLDYFACGSLDVNVARNVVSGVAEGCRQSSAALIGGETAEMPGMYEPGVYDIAGFALGVVERSHILPKINDIAVGDIIIGLPSNGVHSNGFSLIHKLMKKSGLTLNDKAPFSKEGLTLGEELIKPTRIYVRSVLPALRSGRVKAVAHITGGGLLENIPRVIPPAVRARLNAHWWHVHPVFSWIADAGAVQDEEMLRTFNCGIGMVLVVSPEDQAEVMNTTRAFGAMVIGSIQKRPAGGARVVVDNFASAMDFTRRMPLLPKKKVAVLVSGNGSNLQALLDTTREAAQCMCADICLVVSNKKDAYALQRAEKAGVPALVFNHKDYASREEFDRAVSEALEAHKVDIVCLAGYMRILSSEFVKKWHGRLLNIHPSLLPRHPGLHAQKQCLDAGDRESGCTVHFVDEGMDTGPIILQERVPVLQKDTVETLTERIHEAEHRAYPRALRLVATGRVRLNHQGTLMWYS
ncbi:trifunctional purine biosynthetic protein adenosine-3 isoform X2 [Spodoptera frugiperda]|uniref:Trifunctional purine biosynthetic protein adenosine-3 n=1 Tax=Spodoptera frugiperda TaxID=7108 RepID=A0A9R0E7I6_SPOFR|nr:trifunctional purine biosynthetic protein adenosine-3 isoform X2 [Spodoptera frugiperda]